MGQPLPPDKANKIAGKVRELTRKTDETGQAAAGAFIRDPDQSQLPFENDGNGQRTARIPLPDGGVAGVSYDPATPPQSDFGFSVEGPDGKPRNVPGVPGMENGTAKLPPLEVGPAIERASGIDKTTQFAARVSPGGKDRVVGG